MELTMIYAFIITGNLALKIGAIAQLGEQLLCKEKVAGSIPVSST